MLNEWVEIHPMLKQLECDLGQSHPSFNLCPTSKKGFEVCLNANGHIEDVSTPDVPMDSVYRWNEGNHAPAFPVFNVRAFYEVVCDPSVIPNWIARALGLPGTDLLDEVTPNDFVKKNCKDIWEEQDLSLIKQCLSDLPANLRDMLEEAAETPAGYKAFKELVRRTALCPPERFRDEVRAILVHKLQNTRKKDYAEVLFALKKKGGKKKRGKEHGRDFLCLVTIRDWDNPEYGENRYPPYPYQNSPLRVWMARTFEEHGRKTHKPTGKKDAFGNDIAGANDKYTDIKNTADFSKTKLFAANEQIPCLMRYGLTSAALFPAGHDTRELARKSLEYVLSRKREGITWKSLRKYENRNMIVFAYCTKLKDTNAIKVFADDDMEGQESVYISEEATKTALKPFEGIAEADPSAEIVIGIIEVLDDGGNTKVVASRRYPLAHYVAGAKRWQAGCANTPEVMLPWLRLKSANGQKKKAASTTGKAGKVKNTNGALSIYPTRATWLLNSAWRQNGEMITRKEGNQKVPISKRFASSDALDFLFEENAIIQERIVAGLESIVEKSALTLIMARLKAVLDRNKKDNKLDFKDSEYIHMLPTLYGLLLHKKGIKKEDYMEKEVFYLGKLFAAVDRLHICYSQSERNGDIPARLLGNDHMALALQNPQEAFVALGRRLMHPYVSWAKRFQKEQDEGSKESEDVSWCLRDITTLCQRLSEKALPIEIDDGDKAKLILGYLSYGAKTKSDTTGKPEIKKEKEEAIQ